MAHIMTTPTKKTILLAQPRGFCAGVDRAIEIVERALLRFGAPIYVRHEIVHNQYVVAQLKAKGVIFVDEVDEVPDHATLIFSAHGVSQAVRARATIRALQVFDATCPLVTKVHVEVIKMAEQGFHIIMIGHFGHPEVEGTIGQLQPSDITLIEKVSDVASLPFSADTPLAYVTQTTLSVDETRDIIAALKFRYPAIAEPKKQDICYATQNRQDAVKAMMQQVDMLMVVGSPNSSNSQRLVEIAHHLGKPAYLVDDPAKIQSAWFNGIHKIGLTAGASAPEELAQQIIARINALHVCEMIALEGVAEHMSFPLPKELR